MLYASQWLMTVYATPFPVTFCARIIDVMLQVAWLGAGCVHACGGPWCVCVGGGGGRAEPMMTE